MSGVKPYTVADIANDRRSYAKDTFDLRVIYDELCAYAEQYTGNFNTEAAINTLWVRLMDICKREFDKHAYATAYTLDGDKIIIDSVIVERQTVENGVVHIHLRINDKEYIPPQPASTFSEDKMKELSSEYSEHIREYLADKYAGKPNTKDLKDTVNCEARLFFNIRNYIDSSNKEILQYISKLEEEIKELKKLVIEKGDNI